MTKILALSGRKQSGKNTSFNYLLGITMLKLSIVREQIAVTPEGQLWISDIFGDQNNRGIFDIDRHIPEMEVFREETIYPYIKNYSFADALKKDVCMNILGLTYEQCYGTDEQKNSVVPHLLWENMPGVITELPKESYREDDPIEYIKGRLGDYYAIWNNQIFHSPGPMTAREVMQYVGTEVFRKMWGDVWAQACVNKIQRDGSLFAIITDCRFPNEVEMVQKAGGKVVRFTRGSNSKDMHDSEASLDKNKFDWNRFDAVIDNENMSIGEQNDALSELLREWNWIEV